MTEVVSVILRDAERGDGFWTAGPHEDLWKLGLNASQIRRICERLVEEGVLEKNWLNHYSGAARTNNVYYSIRKVQI